MSKVSQGPRTRVVAAKVTPAEKLAVEFVAGAKGTDVSNLLREMSVADILNEHERLRAQIGSAA